MHAARLCLCVLVVVMLWRWRSNVRQDFQDFSELTRWPFLNGERSIMTNENPANPGNPVNPVKTVVGVVGAGTMGNGIAQVAARAGCSVIMHDVRDEFLDRGLSAIDKSLQRDVDKERLDAAGKQSIINRIRRTTDFAVFKEVSFVVEAV